MIRKLLAPVVALGLTGAAIYYAPCLSGDCGEQAVAAGDEEPCDGQAGALAAGDEEPCPYANAKDEEPCHGKDKAKADEHEGPDPAALAAADDEEPCPYATGDKPCHGDKGDKQGAEPSTLAAAEPQAEAAPEAAPKAADGSRS